MSENTTKTKTTTKGGDNIDLLDNANVALDYMIAATSISELAQNYLNDGNDASEIDLPGIIGGIKLLCATACNVLNKTDLY